MRAVTIRDERLIVEQHPDPVPGAGEVLVRVRAAGLNGADMLQRAGFYPPPAGAPPDIPGLELAGVVEACGGRRGGVATMVLAGFGAQGVKNGPSGGDPFRGGSCAGTRFLLNSLARRGGAARGRMRVATI